MLNHQSINKSFFFSFQFQSLLFDLVSWWCRLDIYEDSMIFYGILYLIVWLIKNLFCGVLATGIRFVDDSIFNCSYWILFMMHYSHGIFYVINIHSVNIRRICRICYTFCNITCYKNDINPEENYFLAFSYHPPGLKCFFFDFFFSCHAV